MNQNNSGFLGSIPPVTKNILIINVLCWLAMYVLAGRGLDQVIYKWGALSYVETPFFYPHQFITYMFLHGGFQHMFFNMFAIFMFGRILESVWGPKRFLTYYILTGIGAALAQIIIYYLAIHVFPEYGIMPYPMVGASGAVFGVLVAFGMLFPNEKLFIIPFPFPIKAKYFVIGYGVLELALGLSNNPNDNVAHFAHLGGLITGFFIVLFWKKKDRSSGRFY